MMMIVPTWFVLLLFALASIGLLTLVCSLLVGLLAWWKWTRVDTREEETS